MKKRILLINRFAGGNQVPTGRMLADLIRVLKQEGAHVTVFTGRGDYGGTFGPNSSHEADVVVRPPRLGGDSARIVSWIWFWLCFPVWWLFARRRFDYVVVLTDPPFLPFWFGVIPRPKGLRRVTWWTMDLYPEALVAAGRIRQGGFLHWVLKWLNQVGLRRIDSVASLSLAQLDAIDTYRAIDLAADGCSTVVPPWDLRPVAPIPTTENRLVDEMGWRGKRVALYAGNLGEAHDASAVVSAASHLAEVGDDSWLFVFAVRGSRKRALVDETRALKNVEVHDYFPEARTAELLSSATVHVVTLRDDWGHVLVPSKLFGALATGRPVLFLGPRRALGDVAGVRVLEDGVSGKAVVAAMEELAGVTIPTDTLRARQQSAVRRFAKFVTAD